MKRKRLLTLLGSVCLALMLAVPLVASCAPATPEEAAEDIAELESKLAAEKSKVSGLQGDVSDLEAEIAALKAPAEAEVYVLRGQFIGIPMYEELERFPWGFTEFNGTGRLTSGWIERASDGRLTFDISPVESVVSTGDVLGAIGKGTLDFAPCMYAGYYTGLIPEGNIECGLPFAWEYPMEGFDALENWGLQEEFRAIYAEHNIYSIVFACSDLIQLGTVGVCSTPDHVKGLKLRATGMFGKIVEELGASATTMPWSEFYMALKLGTIDGILCSPGALEATKAKEVLDCWVMAPNMNCPLSSFLFNQDSLNALPDDLKRLITEDLYYVVNVWALQYYSASREAAYQSERDGYIELVEWSAEDSARVKEIGYALWDEVAAKSPRCARLVEIVRDQMRALGKM